MNWVTFFDVIRQIGVVAGTVAAVLRLVIAIFGVIRELFESRRFQITAFLDPSGFVEIQVSNKSGHRIQIQEAQLVRDSSVWRYVVRKIVGLDALISLEQLSWQQKFVLPEEVSAHNIAKLHAAIDTSQHDIEVLRDRKLMLPMVRLEIAGRRTLTKTRLTHGTIITREEKVLVDARKETRTPKPESQE